MIIEGLCKRGHLESEHESSQLWGNEWYGASRLYRHCNSGQCGCYSFENVNLESALGAINLGEV